MPNNDSISTATDRLGPIDAKTSKEVDNLELNNPDRFQSTEKSSNDEEESEDDAEKYPEGGTQAWLVVLGSWCAMTAGMGILNTIGTLHAWISTHQLESYSSSQAGWIFSTFPFFLYFAGVQIGPIFDVYGALPLVIPGSTGLVASLMFLSVSTEYYQIILSFGILGGLSTCCLFTTAISCISHWFSRRRGLATGIACTAGGTGGLAFSLIILFLAPKIGFGWAIRIIGFICAALCLLACLFLRGRLPPNHVGGAKIDIKALRDPPYAATTLAIFLVEFAVFIPYTFIVDQALYAGMGTTTAYALIPILNAAAIPGRLLPGYIADRYGRLNVMTLTAVVCAVLTFALWLAGSASHAAIIAYTALFGFWSGAAISLTPVCIAQVCRVQDIGKRTGTTFTISSLGTLTGIPIAGAILGSAGGDYDMLIVFAGVLYVAAAAAFVLARGLTGGWGARVII